MKRLKKITLGLAATAAIGAGGVALAAPASAANVYSISEHNLVVIELNHAETVAAAQLGAGHVINQVLGNDNWGVVLERSSKYAGGSYYRPAKSRTWNNVTGQQVVAEAAAHPNGRVTLAVDTASRETPLWVLQEW